MQEFIIGELGLAIPKYTGELSRSRQLTPEAVEHWRNHLDLTDLQNSCKAVYLTLIDCQQANLSPADLFQVLSVLRPTVSYLSHSLAKLCPNQKGVIKPNHRTILDLSLQLNLQIYHGYKIIIEQMNSQFFAQKELTLATLFSCFYIASKLIFETSFQYRKNPKFLWKELHILYRIAVKKKLHKKSLSNLKDCASRFENLEDVYKHALLFSITQTNHHTPEQLEQLRYTIESWAPLMQFEKSSKKNMLPYYICEELDRGPVYITDSSQIQEKGMFISLAKITEHLEDLCYFLEHPESLQNENAFSSAETSTSVELVKFLLTHWKKRPTRSQVRQKVSGEIEVCLGINAAHWFLNNSQESHDSHESITDPKSYQEVETIDLGDIANTHSSNTESIEYTLNQCEMVDESKGGLCLKWLQAPPSNFRCGEIILMKRNYPEGIQWHIGVIRWLKENEIKELIFGIQLIGHCAYPSFSWMYESNKSQGVRTLFMPENKELNKPMTLITPTIPFKTGNEIKVSLLNNTYHASLQKNYNPSENFFQFELEFFENSPQVEQTSLPIPEQDSRKSVHKH